MSSRTAHWAAHSAPSTPPPPPSRRSTTPAPTIYPESSVSNPNASRYTGRPSRSHSVGPTAAPSAHSSSNSRRSASQSRYSNTRLSSRSGTPVPLQTYYAQPQQPIIARTSGPDGRTDSYMIIPAKGQKVEILHPTPVRSSTMPPSSSSSYAYSSSTRAPASAKEKPLLKRLFSKVDWTADRARSRSSSITRTPSAASASTSHSARSRRNSTGSAGWTVVSGGSRVVSAAGGSRVVTSSRGGYDVVRL